MSEEFIKEARYIVFKIKDMEKYCGERTIQQIMGTGYMIAKGREKDGKPTFNAVVVEQDWPEFDTVWAMIEARMTGGTFEMPPMPAGAKLRCPRCGDERSMSFSYASAPITKPKGGVAEQLFHVQETMTLWKTGQLSSGDAMARLFTVTSSIPACDMKPVSEESLAVGMRFCCGKEEELVLEVSRLRNVIQCGMIDGKEGLIRGWNRHFPESQFSIPPVKVEIDFKTPDDSEGGTAE